MSDIADRYAAEVIHVAGRSVARVACRDSGISACLSPDDGAELSSLVIDDALGLHELLYRGNDWRTVDGWPGRAPWLWPVAGRTYGRYDMCDRPEPRSVFHWRLDGQVLPMSHHGYARARRWRPDAMGEHGAGAFVSAFYQSTREDHLSYPFNYRLDSAVSLCDSTFSITLRVTAAPDNNQPMPFTVGQHLTFDFRSWWGDDWLNGTLQGAGDTAWGIDGLMLAADCRTLPSAPLTLGGSELKDLLIPAVPGKKLRLRSPDGTRCLDLSLATSALPSPDAALWVTHCDVAGRFFCLEPWVGWPNGINTGRGRVDLEPGGSWSISVQMNIMATGRESSALRTSRGDIQINPAVIESIPRRAKQPRMVDQTIREDT